MFFTPKECVVPYSISEINAIIADTFESGNTLIWVEGELSNVRFASSGHLYMRIKDQQSSIPAVMWRSVCDDLDFEPEDGLAVIIIASVKVYRRGGYYQLDIHKMNPSGVGALSIAFEKLKKKLYNDGFFDEKHKKLLPDSVNTVGIVTAKTGAAFRDIIRVIATRSPQTNILLRSCAVQGDGAAKQIALSVKELNKQKNIDVIIVGRGGGSSEDLWVFNEEPVVRAVYESKIPIISAVGHEIDFSLCDFAADVRAATPSAAADMAVSDREDDMRFLGELIKRFSYFSRSIITSRKDELKYISEKTAFHAPFERLREGRITADSLADALSDNFCNAINNRKKQCWHNATTLQALSPLNILSRGYSVVTNNSGKRVLSPSDVCKDDIVSIRMHLGTLKALVKSTTIL